MYRERFKEWSENPYFDEETRNELLGLENPSEIEDRFYRDIEFGTGGMRGIIGAGTNRINIYVIRRATQGLAEYILENRENTARGVVIAYDSRKYSKLFALEVALVLAKNKIKSYLFEDLRPTPELSFAVRYLNANAGIVITASHNPKEYNGFKIYWEDGGQVPPSHSDKIYQYIRRHNSVVGIIPAEKAEAIKLGLLVYIGEELDFQYLKSVKNLVLNRTLINEKGTNLKIIYTPLHGTGIKVVPRALKELGFNSVLVVKEQEYPDPNFSTVIYPNPELEESFKLAKTYANSVNSDLIMATDPDTDRLGIMIKDQDNNYMKLTGNQLGVLLEYYLLTQKRDASTLPKNGVIVKTIASTELADKIASKMGVSTENVLTGFKYIAEKIKIIEEQGIGHFLFGFEESNGYLAGDFVRDKDAVIASVLIADAALYYKEVKHRTLFEILEEIYSIFGYYLEEQRSFTLEGKEGHEKIKRIMSWLRNNPQKKFGNLVVGNIEDYSLGRPGFPKSNVLRYTLSGGGFVMSRPSGTEPKIKFYFLTKGLNKQEANDKMETLLEFFLKPIVEAFQLD